MDAKEIEQKSKALQKSSQANEPASNIIAILKDLQKGVRPTEELLRSTKIGIVVNKMKTSKQREVAILANEIVSRWRSEVNKQKERAGSGASTPVASKTNGVANGASSSPAPASAPPAPEPKKSSVPPDKRTWKADKVDTKLYDDQTRNGCLGLMYDGLCLNSTEAPDTVLAKARDVEKAALDAYGPSKESAYKEKIRSLFQNLKNKSNPGLRVRVLTGEVAPERFVRMTHEELKSAEQKLMEDKMKKENMDKAMVAKEEATVSSSLQCGKCGKKEGRSLFSSKPFYDMLSQSNGTSELHSSTDPQR